MLKLPEDIPLQNVSGFKIPGTDPRKGLRGQLGLRATAKIFKGDIIGPYRGHVMWAEEFDAHKRYKLPAGWIEDGKMSMDYALKVVSLACIQRVVGL